MISANNASINKISSIKYNPLKNKWPLSLINYHKKNNGSISIEIGSINGKNLYIKIIKNSIKYLVIPDLVPFTILSKINHKSIKLTKKYQDKYGTFYKNFMEEVPDNPRKIIILTLSLQHL